MLLRTHTIGRLGRCLGTYQCTRFQRPSSRAFHATCYTSDSSFTNLLADADNPPPVQVSSISDQEGIRLVDGLVLPAACIFLEGQVYLWDVPSLKTENKPSEVQWQGWTKDHFELFDVVVPKPEILLLGTGKRIVQPPSFMRTYLNDRGIQLDVMDTRNACATYNLLAEEGRRVAAALLPNDPLKRWNKMTVKPKTGSS